MVKRLVPLPVIIIIDDDPAHRACTILSRLTCSLTIPEIMRDGARPGVEQGLMRIEAKTALLGVARAFETPVVVHASRQSLNVDVPAIERPVEDRVEVDHLERRRAPRLFVQ